MYNFQSFFTISFSLIFSPFFITGCGSNDEINDAALIGIWSSSEEVAIIFTFGSDHSWSYYQMVSGSKQNEQHGTWQLVKQKGVIRLIIDRPYGGPITYNLGREGEQIIFTVIDPENGKEMARPLHMKRSQ